MYHDYNFKGFNYMNKKWTLEEDNFIINNFKNKSKKEIAAALNRSYFSVGARYKYLSICLDRVRITSSNVNINFFDNWTSELSYIVGLFVADGCISNYDTHKINSVRICNSNLFILKKIAYLIGFTGKIKGYNRKNRDHLTEYTLEMRGKAIWSFFNELGFDNNKSVTAKVPKTLPLEFINHFIRGIFDGDGSVSNRKRHSGILYPNARVCGTYAVINEINNKFNCGNMFKTSSIFVVDYNGENAVKFLDYIYKDSTIHFDIKYQKYLKIKEWVNTCRRWSEEDKDYLIKNYKVGNEEVISIALNRTVSSILNKAFKLGLMRKKRWPTKI